MQIEKTNRFAASIARKIEGFEGDTFRKEDVDRIASEVVDELKEHLAEAPRDERKIIILDILSQTVSRFISQSEYTSNELAEMLSPFVHAVTERIKTIIYIDPEINEDDLALVERNLVSAGKVVKLRDTNKVFKRSSVNIVERERNKLALEALHECLENDPCPWVVYPVLETNSTGNINLLREIDITPLNDRLNPYEESINLREALQILLDGMKGMLYLDQKGFALRDIHSANIGVNRANRGFLLDLCSLSFKPVGAEVEPNAMKSFDMGINVVVSFGEILFQIINRYASYRVFYDAKNKKTNDLFMDMVGEGKRKIITLQAAITRLQSIIEKMPVIS